MGGCGEPCHFESWYRVPQSARLLEAFAASVVPIGDRNQAEVNNRSTYWVVYEQLPHA